LLISNKREIVVGTPTEIISILTILADIRFVTPVNVQYQNMATSGSFSRYRKKAIYIAI